MTNLGYLDPDPGPDLDVMLLFLPLPFVEATAPARWKEHILSLSFFLLSLPLMEAGSVVGLVGGSERILLDQQRSSPVIFHHLRILVLLHLFLEQF